MDFAALAAVGLFGGGLAVGGSNACGLQGPFGSCHDQSKANAKNEHRLADFQNAPTVHVTESMTTTDEKLFLAENELAALNAIQPEKAAYQDSNWVILREKVAIYEQNFHIAINFYSSSKNFYFLFNKVSSLPCMTHASVKSYHSVLFAFRMHSVSSVPVLLKGHLPMSLLHLELLVAIFYSVSFWQSKAGNRLILASPASNLLSYYISGLLADAITVSEGLLLTLNIPLSAQQTVFTLFEAKPTVTFPPDDLQSALTWNMEASYLALSENKLQSSVLSVEQFEHCFGLSKY